MLCIFHRCYWKGKVCPDGFVEEIYTDMGLCVMFNNKTNDMANNTGEKAS